MLAVDESRPSVGALRGRPKWLWRDDNSLVRAAASRAAATSIKSNHRHRNFVTAGAVMFGNVQSSRKASGAFLEKRTLHAHQPSSCTRCR